MPKSTLELRSQGTNKSRKKSNTSLKSLPESGCLSKTSSSLDRKVKEVKPETILMDLQIIIQCHSMDIEYFTPYLKGNINDYLKRHWSDPSVIEAVKFLQEDSYNERIKKERIDCPFVEAEEIVGTDISIAKTAELVVWQIEHRTESPASLKLQREVLVEALEKDIIQLPVFDDVIPALKAWRKNYKLRIYVHSALDRIFSDKIMAHTKAGNLHKYIDGFMDSSFGPLESKETYTAIASALRLPPTSILYFSGYGKAGKAATQIGFNILLVQRPRVRLREYYQTKFPTLETLTGIQFVEDVESSECIKSTNSGNCDSG